MRRTDILKLQLKNSRGRFFTANYIGPLKTPMNINFKVSEILRETPRAIQVKAYVPKLEAHRVLTFFLNKEGDLQYLASDRTKIQMSGLGL